jgi:hypothetical protein
MGGGESWNNMTDQYPGNNQLLCLTISFHSCTVPTKTFADLTPIRRSFYVFTSSLCSVVPILLCDRTLLHAGIVNW